MRSAALTALAFALITSPAAAQQVAGRYQIQGTNFDGSAYSGTAEIVLTSDSTCRIVWVTGGTTSRGICMRNGTSFSAAYSMGGAVGLAIYEIKPDGAIEGLWTVADQRGSGTERLTPLK